MYLIMRYKKCLRKIFSGKREREGQMMEVYTANVMVKIKGIALSSYILLECSLVKSSMFTLPKCNMWQNICQVYKEFCFLTSL